MRNDATYDELIATVVQQCELYGIYTSGSNESDIASNQIHETATTNRSQRKTQIPRHLQGSIVMSYVGHQKIHTVSMRKEKCLKSWTKSLVNSLEDSKTTNLFCSLVMQSIRTVISLWNSP